MWKTEVDGQQLHFVIKGVNNQNFIMEDIETGSWWQQVTGEAIFGPLKGKRLELLSTDEVSFALWKQENPAGQVLQSEQEFQSNYFRSGWEETAAGRMPKVAGSNSANSPLADRALVVGIERDGQARAYPLVVLREQNPIVDSLGPAKLLVVLGPDGKSVRCFETSLDGRKLNLYLAADSDSFSLVDTQTGSRWNFSGEAIAGPLKGAHLTRVPVLREFWFDWKNYHPETTLYSAGRLPGAN